MFGDLETMRRNGTIDNEQEIKERSISNLLTIVNTPAVWNTLPKETQDSILFILKGYAIGSAVRAIRYGNELDYVSAEDRQSIGYEEIRNEFVPEEIEKRRGRR